MSDYTLDQINFVTNTLRESLGLEARHILNGNVHAALIRLHDAGITLNFPEPRFYVVNASFNEHSAHNVYGRQYPRTQAIFFGPNSKRYADQHAERLEKKTA